MSLGLNGCRPSETGGHLILLQHYIQERALLDIVAVSDTYWDNISNGYSIPDEIPTTLAFSSVNWCKIDVFTSNTVADPGFPVGGYQPLMWALFGKNICKNERIGSQWQIQDFPLGGAPIYRSELCRL